MPYSHHSHSGQFCKHAVDTLEDVVTEAIRQGFRVFGLSEHVPRYGTSDLYPEEDGLTPDDLIKQFEEYVEEAHRLKRVYQDEVTLLVGLETEYITSLDLDNLEKLLERFGEKVEYIVGSVHHVRGIPIDFDLSTFQSCLATFAGETEHERMEEFLCAYFDAQYEVLERFRPEIIGHIDLCRLYNPRLSFSDYPRAEEKLERNVRLAVDYGALFEVSTAPFRKGWDTPYPGQDVLEIIIKDGGKFALSDDSHGKHAVGLNYERLANYLQMAGVTEIYHLAGGAAGVRKAHAVLVEGDWRRDCGEVAK